MELESPFTVSDFRDLSGHQGGVFLGIGLAVAGSDVRVFKVGVLFHTWSFFDKNAAVQGIPPSGNDNAVENRLCPAFEFLFDAFLVVEVKTGK